MHGSSCDDEFVCDLIGGPLDGQQRSSPHFEDTLWFTLIHQPHYPDEPPSTETAIYKYIGCGAYIYQGKGSE